jgi:hypothetical protein
VATAGAEAATAVAVLVVAGSMREALPVAVSTAVVVSMADVSAAALSTALAFVVTVLVGATGVATGTITDSLMMSSSEATAFRGGWVGTTDTTVTAITRTITMDTADTHTTTTDTADTVTTVGPVTDTAMAADQAISGVGDTVCPRRRRDDRDGK